MLVKEPFLRFLYSFRTRPAFSKSLTALRTVLSEIDSSFILEGDVYYLKDDNSKITYLRFDRSWTPPDIQYWFEDFSSNYGDYGWLKYESYDNEWYVEIGPDIWEIVENPPDYFWFTDYISLSKVN